LIPTPGRQANFDFSLQCTN